MLRLLQNRETTHVGRACSFDKEQFIKLVRQGLSTRQLAAEMNRSQTNIRHQLKKLGLKTQHKRYGSKYLPGDSDSAEVELDCAVHGRTLFRGRLRENGSYRYQCLRCGVENVDKRRKRIKLELVKEAGGECLKCGYDRHPRALHFHHRDAEDKEFMISAHMASRSIDEIKKEAGKCDLYCANCHLIEHSQLGFFHPNQTDSMRSMHKRKLSLIHIAGGECDICQNNDPRVLTFHHVRPEDKSFGLSSTTGFNRRCDLVYAEVEKCVLLCLNCHLEIEAGLHPQKVAKWNQEIPPLRMSFAEWKQKFHGKRGIPILRD